LSIHRIEGGRFIQRGKSNLTFYLTTEEFSVSDDGIRFWKLIEPYFNVAGARFVASGYYEVNGKTVYVIKFLSTKKRVTYYNVLMFTECNGKLFQANLVSPAEDVSRLNSTGIYHQIVQIFLPVKRGSGFQPSSHLPAFALFHMLRSDGQGENVRERRAKPACRRTGTSYKK
jgi:hypothetical protein